MDLLSGLYVPFANPAAGLLPVLAAPAPAEAFSALLSGPRFQEAGEDMASALLPDMAEAPELVAEPAALASVPLVQLPDAEAVRLPRLVVLALWQALPAAGYAMAESGVAAPMVDADAQAPATDEPRRAELEMDDADAPALLQPVAPFIVVDVPVKPFAAPAAVPETPVFSRDLPVLAVPPAPLPPTSVPLTSVPLTSLPETPVPETPVFRPVLPQRPEAAAPVPMAAVPTTPVPTTPVPTTPVPVLPMVVDDARPDAGVPVLAAGPGPAVPRSVPRSFAGRPELPVPQVLAEADVQLPVMPGPVRGVPAAKVPAGEVPAGEVAVAVPAEPVLPGVAPLPVPQGRASALPLPVQPLAAVLPVPDDGLGAALGASGARLAVAVERPDGPVRLAVSGSRAALDVALALPPETLPLARSQSEDLSRALAEQGVRVAGFSLTSSVAESRPELRAESETGGDDRRGDSQGRGQGETRGPRVPAALRAALPDTEIPPPRAADRFA
jgi:hypothetical protein